MRARRRPGVGGGPARRRRVRGPPRPGRRRGRGHLSGHPAVGRGDRRLRGAAGGRPAPGGPRSRGPPGHAPDRGPARRDRPRRRRPARGVRQGADRPLRRRGGVDRRGRPARARRSHRGPRAGDPAAGPDAGGSLHRPGRRPGAATPRAPAGHRVGTGRRRGHRRARSGRRGGARRRPRRPVVRGRPGAWRGPIGRAHWCAPPPARARAALRRALVAPPVVRGPADGAPARAGAARRSGGPRRPEPGGRDGRGRDAGSPRRHRTRPGRSVVRGDRLGPGRRGGRASSSRSRPPRRPTRSTARRRPTPWCTGSSAGSTESRDDRRRSRSSSRSTRAWPTCRPASRASCATVPRRPSSCSSSTTPRRRPPSPRTWTEFGASEHGVPVRVLRNPENLGFVRTVNRGLRDDAGRRRDPQRRHRGDRRLARPDDRGGHGRAGRRDRHAAHELRLDLHAARARSSTPSTSTATTPRIDDCAAFVLSHLARAAPGGHHRRRLLHADAARGHRGARRLRRGDLRPGLRRGGRLLPAGVTARLLATSSRTRRSCTTTAVARSARPAGRAGPGVGAPARPLRLLPLRPTGGSASRIRWPCRSPRSSSRSTPATRAAPGAPRPARLTRRARRHREAPAHAHRGGRRRVRRLDPLPGRGRLRAAQRLVQERGRPGRARGAPARCARPGQQARRRGGA